MKRFLSLIAAIMIAPSTSFGESVCGAGKHLGSENDGAGMSWKCLPNTEPQSAIPIRPGSNNLNNIGAALTLGASILDLAQNLAGTMKWTDNNGQAEEDTEGSGAASREDNRRAFEEMQKGKFLRASILFTRAADEARDAHNEVEYRENMKNAQIALIESELRKGYEFEQNQKYKDASLSYRRAIVYAEEINDDTLIEKLKSYNDTLSKLASKSGHSRDVLENNRHCDEIRNNL